MMNDYIDNIFMSSMRPQPSSFLNEINEHLDPLTREVIREEVNKMSNIWKGIPSTEVLTTLASGKNVLIVDLESEKVQEAWKLNYGAIFVTLDDPNCRFYIKEEKQ